MKSLYRMCLAASVLFVSAAASYAQDLKELLSKVMQHAGTSCVMIGYKFATTAGDARISDEGYVEAQGNMWHLKGQTLELFTDSTSTWIVDNETKEVIVEPCWSYDDLDAFYASAVRNGADMKISIVSEKVVEMKPVSYFTPSFDKTWIVTDLR